MKIDQYHRVIVPNRYGETKGRLIHLENARGEPTEDLDRVRWARIHFNDGRVTSFFIDAVDLDIDYYKNLYAKFLLVKSLKSHLDNAIKWYM